MKSTNFNKFLKLLVPRDHFFYPTFEEYSMCLVSAGSSLKELLTNLKDSTPEEIEQKFLAIKAIEVKGDQLNKLIQNELNSTFITPFDREDVQTLAWTLDEVLDYICGTAQKIKLYKPKNNMTEFIDLVNIIDNCVKEIKEAIWNLRKIHKNYELIEKACNNIHSLEEQADDIYHIAEANLFEIDIDIKELIKNKKILENLEKTVDYAEDVADIIQKVVKKSV